MRLQSSLYRCKPMPAPADPRGTARSFIGLISDEREKSRHDRW